MGVAASVTGPSERRRSRATLGTRIAAAALGAGAARLAFSAARRAVEGERAEPDGYRPGAHSPFAGSARARDPKLWNRVNHRGEPVTLLEGPAYAAGAAAALAMVPGVPGPLRAAAVGSAVGAGAFGVYDDLCGNGDRRGMRGHLAALSHGEVTTGGVKILGIGSVGLLAGFLVRRGPQDTLVDKLLAGVTVAAAANAVNLLDLRPGRAIKAAALAAAPAVARSGEGAGIAAVRCAGLGAALALLPEDLDERAMLGDAGANALGAVLGTAAAASAPSRAALFGRAALLTAVTLASEKVSFTKVIAGCPPLRALDGLGRRA
jgi:UDP-N-acetylmuramyl pentapeptide phosphotransferase/UDP-N-acetylglucosamine-1-phosphate transferase